MKKNEFLGKGKKGVVYKGCLNNKCNYKYARKESLNNLKYEFKLMSLLHPLDPTHIVEPYHIKKYKNHEILFMEYINIYKNKNIPHKNIKKIIKQIINFLLKIQKKYPSFRHNDLYWDNVFVTTEGKVHVGDFGFGNINIPGYRNPMVTSGDYKVDWGIFPKNSKNYDIHLFLNSVHQHGTQRVKTFIETLVPRDYLGTETPKILNSRMRYDVDHSHFPSMEKIFSKL